MTVLRISLKACVRGLLAGHTNVQLPHSQHSIPFNFSNVSQSFLSAAAIIFWGTRNSGQALTHLPQRMHGVGASAATWSLVKQVSAEEVLATGMSRL